MSLMFVFAGIGRGMRWLHSVDMPPVSGTNSELLVAVFFAVCMHVLTVH